MNALNDIWDKFSAFMWGSRTIAIKFQQVNNDSFVDNWLSEKHEYAASFSQYPVESGFVVSDNMVLEPKKITVSGYISSIKSVPYTLSLLNYKTTEKLRDGWSILTGALEAGEPLTVATSLGIYDNMFIENLSSEEIDEKSGLSLVFKLDLKEIRTAQSQTTTTNVVIDKNSPYADKNDPIEAAGQNQTETIAMLNSMFNNMINSMFNGGKN